MEEFKDKKKGKDKKPKQETQKIPDNKHVGSSNAFEETENTLSRDADNISDEKLDELLGG